MRSSHSSRYERHFMLEEVGVEGQHKLSESKVLIIGAGGLGSPIALYLAASGVGTLGIADGDTVDITNLQRQILHFTTDLDKKKVHSASKKLNEINPEVSISKYDYFLDEDSLPEVVREYDVVVDATDNFKSKFLINDVCVREKKVLSQGGVLKFSGQVTTIYPQESACYRCVFGDIPPNPEKYSKAGILGSVAGIVGSIQATEVLKVIIGIDSTLKNKLLTIDAKTMAFRSVNIKRDDNCPTCRC